MRSCFVLLSAVLLHSMLTAQSSTPSPAFDVASVKFTSHGRNADGSSTSGFNINPGRLVGIRVNLQECIEWAYQVEDYQISGPAWVSANDAIYDIEAKAPAGTKPVEMQAMLQTLLRERFHLQVHREKRILPAYLLKVAKGGPRLSPSAGPEGGLFSLGSTDGVHVTGDSATMKSLADRLSRDVGRPVFDNTGIAGAYRINLQWAREGDGPSVFGAVEEQLGLRLEKTKMPIDTLVIDSAEKTPAAN